MTDRILESKPLTRIFSFFVVNPGRAFSVRELQRKLGGKGLPSYLNALVREGALQSSAKKNVRFYKLSKRYHVPPSFRNQAVKMERKYADEFKKMASKVNGLKALIMTGIFSGYPRLECDLVIVGKLSSRAINKIISEAEKAAGQEINYALFTDKEFEYRRNIFDKFMKDVFENDHYFVINKTK